jgi:hypothetical protein
MRLSMLSIEGLFTRTKETAGRFPLPGSFLFAGAINHLYMDIFKVEGFTFFSRNIFMELLLLVFYVQAVACRFGE